MFTAEAESSCNRQRSDIGCVAAPIDLMTSLSSLFSHERTGNQTESLFAIGIRCCDVDLGQSTGYMRRVGLAQDLVIAHQKDAISILKIAIEVALEVGRNLSAAPSSVHQFLGQGTHFDTCRQAIAQRLELIAVQIAVCELHAIHRDRDLIA